MTATAPSVGVAQKSRVLGVWMCTGLFTLLSVIVTAANLPLYLTCTLAIVVMGWRGTGPVQRKPSLLVMGAGVLAALFCVWATRGIGIKALLWTLGLTACCVPIYVWSRLKANSSKRARNIQESAL